MGSMTQHSASFYVSQVMDGALCRRDTGAIVRRVFQFPFLSIDNGRQLRAALREAGDNYGAFAFWTDDGANLCGACVRANLRAITSSIRANSRDGWRVAHLGSGSDAESAVTCDHCGAHIHGELQS